MTRQFTNLELANCAKREVGQRKWVYPRRVASRDMTQEKADRELAMMEQIEREYREKANLEREQSDLLDLI
jgi:hypothetical protein